MENISGAEKHTSEKGRCGSKSMLGRLIHTGFEFECVCAWVAVECASSALRSVRTLQDPSEAGANDRGRQRRVW